MIIPLGDPRRGTASDVLINHPLHPILSFEIFQGDLPHVGMNEKKVQGWWYIWTGDPYISTETIFMCTFFHMLI